MEAAAKAKIEKAQKRKFDTQCQAEQAVLSETIARAAKRTAPAATTPVAPTVADMLTAGATATLPPAAPAPPAPADAPTLADTPAPTTPLVSPADAPAPAVDAPAPADHVAAVAALFA